MVFLFLASVLLAISTLAAPGPVDSVFYNNAVEVPDASGLYASVPSNTAACLTCQCNIDCPDECGCGTQTNPSPPTPPTLTNSAPAPKQYCEDLGAPGCPFRCRNGICYCYSYCSRNTCEVKLNGVVQKEGICAPAVVGTCLRYCIAHCVRCKPFFSGQAALKLLTRLTVELG